MNMSVTYLLSCEDKEQCFQIRRRGTVFEKEPAYITAYEVCKGLNEYYSNGKMNIPIRDAHTGKRFHDLPLTATVDKMINWLRDKHDIFYIKAINLCIPLEDPLSMRVKRFWEGEDERQKQIEEYCTNDVTVSEVLASVKKERDELKERLENLEGGGYACSGCKRTTCGYFFEVLGSLGLRVAVVYPSLGQSKVETLAKLANERAKAIFSEHQSMQKQIEELNEQIHNQEQTIKTQNESLTKQRKQLNDLGASLRDIKEVVDCEMDDLMKTHGDDIIPVF